MASQDASPASRSADERLRISEIFFSLQGETRTVGLPTIFIRLTGCPLRCGYCDTSYAFQGGEWYSIDQIMDEISRFTVRRVTVTGGEPLAQRACHSLLSHLCDKGYEVSLETSGALDLCDVDARVVRVMDLKTPGSGECEKNRFENLACLDDSDQVKFVITDRTDYDWAVECCKRHALLGRCEVLFSPSHGQLEARSLADWILEDQLPVRLQIQLHKYLWGDQPGR
ncbi:MAG: 7-carboxy-7-deazaguanine synthase QueE [Pseudomonadota bacterium]|nr:MAG: 7-carboxy-7-deazaguanine synthase QueE [Pseudomonadota bacterium]